MKRILTAVLAALGVGAAAHVQKPAPASMMMELRARALATRPADIGLVAEQFASQPWGVLMETGLTDGAAYSLVVLADDTTSLYFSVGGGIIGAGTHEAVHTASMSMLKVAAKLQSHAEVVSATPLPPPGRVQFYLLSANGVLGYAADEQRLGNDQDRLSELFHAGHLVIAQVRIAEESKAGPRK